MDSGSLEIYKSKLLEVFKGFIAICETHNLQYYCCGGTAIGAVRHQGLIPWDDDIDVFMPRYDYEKFIEVFNRDYFEEYDLLNPSTTSNYYLSYLKMCDKHSSILEHKEIPCVFGVFIDIFPLDGASDDARIQKKMLVKFKKNANKLNAISKRFKDNIRFFFKRLFKGQLITAYNELVFSLFKQYQRGRVLNSLDKISTAYSYSDSKSVCNYGGMWGMKEFAKKEWFISSKKMSFEGLSVELAGNYDAYLKNIYGDYMTPPPLEKQISHHHVAFLDVNKRLTIDEVLSIINKRG